MWLSLLVAAALAAPPLTVELTCAGLADSSHSLLGFDEQGNELDATVVPAGETLAFLHPPAPVHRLVVVGAACVLDGTLPPGEHDLVWLSEAGIGTGPDPVRCQALLAPVLDGGALSAGVERCIARPEVREQLLSAWPQLAPEVRYDRKLVALLDGPELRAALLSDRADVGARRRLVELWKATHDARDPPWLIVGEDRVLVTDRCRCPGVQRPPELIAVGPVLVLRPDAEPAQAMPLPPSLEAASIACSCALTDRSGSQLLWSDHELGRQQSQAATTYAKEHR